MKMTNSHNKLGYERELYILPFDHRGSFLKLLGIVPPLDEEQVLTVKKYKELIYKAFEKCAGGVVPKEEAAILVDEQFGGEILEDAGKKGYVRLLTVEKSGQEEFDFQYGEDFREHIKKINPVFAKALVRFDPRAEQDLNKRQLEKLKILCDFCRSEDYKLLVEILTAGQGDEKALYQKDTISMFQQSGVEPDVWKIEGLNKTSLYQEVLQQARRDGREKVGVVILGRGESREAVEQWIKQGAGVGGVIGFAIGRTLFSEALLMYKEGKISQEETVDKIAQNYAYFYNLYKGEKSS